MTWTYTINQNGVKQEWVSAWLLWRQKPEKSSGVCVFERVWIGGGGSKKERTRKDFSFTFWKQKGNRKETGDKWRSPKGPVVSWSERAALRKTASPKPHNRRLSRSLAWKRGRVRAGCGGGYARNRLLNAGPLLCLPPVHYSPILELLSPLLMVRKAPPSKG